MLKLITLALLISTTAAYADVAEDCAALTGERGIKACGAAIASAPRQAAHYHNRGIKLLELGQLDRAVSDFDKALQLDPASAKSHNSRANVYRARRDYDRALAEYNRATELAPKYADPYVGRASIFRLRGEATAALAELSKAQ